MTPEEVSAAWEPQTSVRRDRSVPQIVGWILQPVLVGLGIVIAIVLIVNGLF